ncbi:hypothetical protein NW133_06235 [Staphylococcus pettenkoferi]|uniref:Uncharacterized protein n=1 Tax=Staphylococcus pettenkoferi TaxID=170573 RepID=A0ABT4BKH0_9STAP|nr:hypothetical protein [Staphylococcus pettenkoferi]MCY1565301.1 hypothetical protein [Staphylococcus pettenkoferi]MCY1572495.1 hypothetical protein [Staphylococcus pettenkoferi]MCY1583124.1 hypothetical protein [Staphylococcus pettenkoferi]MCY1591184.1 hypothetical protein [Staphylococcus pettenkoferi]MCY1597402.1 hypothetical protein [Staphylococcus pettenkoferi]
MEEKEQLAQDFALIAEGDREISINNSLISKKNKEINEYILKKEKQKLLLFLLLPAIICIFFLSVLLKGFAVLIGFILLFTYIYCRWAVNNRNALYKRTGFYKNILSKIKSESEVTQRVDSIESLEIKNKNIYRNVAETGALDRVPTKYQDYNAVVMMFDYLANHRADTLKECINLYETECHQMRLEQQQKQMINTAEHTLNASRAAQKAANIAAGNSAVAAAQSTRAAYHSKNADEQSAEAAGYSAQAARNSAEAARDSDTAAYYSEKTHRKLFKK